jgi:DNA-binding CsgD family transcriptional regulator
LRDEEGTAVALLNLGMAVMSRGELERSKTLLEEGLPLFRGLGDKWGLTRSLLCLGLAAMFQGDDERAKALIEESLAVSQESGDVYCSSMALNLMALMALLREDYGRAQALCKESLQLSRPSGMEHLIAVALHTSAALAGSRGQPLRSARLWGAAEALREAMGTVFTPLELRTLGPYIAAARAQEEEASWEAAWQKGRAMSMEEAIDYVLLEGEETADTTAPAQKGSSIPAQATTLTRREQEVVTLVARGLTNRQIAAELSISKHTIATHVGKTMRKLGLSSRSQLAAWMIEQGRSSSHSG